MTSNPPGGCIVIGPNRDGGIDLAVDEFKPTRRCTRIRHLISDEVIYGRRAERTESLRAIGNIERFLDETARDS
jgi:hypothetical protein